MHREQQLKRYVEKLESERDRLIEAESLGEGLSGSRERDLKVIFCNLESAEKCLKKHEKEKE